MITTQQQIKVNDVQIEGLQRQNQHSKIVTAEVAGVSDRTDLYQSIGRM